MGSGAKSEEEEAKRKGFLIYQEMHKYITIYEAKSSTEVTKCMSSNILGWFGRDVPEKSVAGLRESLFLVLLQNLQKD